MTTTTTKLKTKQKDFLIYLFLIHRPMAQDLINITVYKGLEQFQKNISQSTSAPPMNVPMH